ncbi:MAG: hypothetical protein R3F41_16135 [Gammaproteobacteria bacterium]|nr:hypothetical protein [Pseudomonadales bacterium]MCP5346698.1 hypothetical protein [Pseudomonadales bacterium]
MKIEVRKSIRAMAKAGVLAGSLVGLGMLGQGANAASGEVDVEINFPSLVILYYYDDINIAVNSSDFAEALNNGATGCVASPDGNGLSCAAGSAFDVLDTDSASISGTTLTYTADIQTEAGATSVPNDLSFVLRNVWAVRALVPSGASLSASVTNTGDFTNLGITPTTPAASMTLSNTNGGNDNVGDLSFDVSLNDLANDLSISDTLEVTVVSSL